MPATALALYALWFVLAFGARIAVSVRRTGDTGVRGMRAVPLSIEWLAGVLFLVALVVGVAAPVAAIAGLDPINALDTPAVAWTGVAIGAVGVLLTLAAQLSMGARCTARRTSAIERASVVSFRGSVGRLRYLAPGAPDARGCAGRRATSRAGPRRGRGGGRTAGRGRRP